VEPNEAMGVFFGGVLLVTLVGIVGGFLHYRRERLLSHQERMKALELGREIPDDPATARMKAARGVASSSEKTASSDKNAGASGALARRAFSTALWAALGGFAAAVVASESDSTERSPATVAVSVAVAASAGAVGVTAVICGTILGMRAPSSGASSATGKMEIESDAVDVVSRRG
jgi:hypothetical protein